MQQSDKEESDNSESDLEAEEKSQKDYLKNLGQADPEFYKFLQEEGDEALLNPQDDDEDSDAEEGTIQYRIEDPGRFLILGKMHPGCS